MAIAAKQACQRPFGNYQGHIKSHRRFLGRQAYSRVYQDPAQCFSKALLKTMFSFHRCGFASGRSRWLRRKILLLPIFQSLIDGADLPDGAEEFFATSIALDGHLHAPTEAAFKKCSTLRQSQAGQRHPKATYDL